MLFNNENKREELEELVQPVMEFLERHTNPHCKVIIDSKSAELVEGLTGLERKSK